MNNIFHASIETRSFLFEGFGSTREQAVQALGKAWDEHAASCKKNGADVPQFDAALEEFDMTVRERALGQGYRDHQPLGK